jgi:5'-nucleotidase
VNIVVTNDDGLHTKGIWALAEAVGTVGSVSVVAPDREQSGVGVGITLQHPVKISEAISRLEGVRTLSVEGTPADSVLLALQGLTPQPVDLVVSGINEGANLGMNVLVSGTVGAAFQAHFFGVPAVALSVATPMTETEPKVRQRANFEASARFAQVIARLFRDKVLSGPMLLNVNFPNVPLADIEGVKITRLAKGRYVDTLEKLPTDRHTYYWIARGRPEWVMEEGTDVWALRNRYISVTPLHIDLTHDMSAPLLQGFGPEIFKALKGEKA